MENMECLIIKMRALFINLKVSMSLDHGISLRFVLLPAVLTCWVTFQAKNNIRRAPASSALTLVSYPSHNTPTTNCHLHAKGEGSGVQRRTKVSFGRTII